MSDKFRASGHLTWSWIDRRLRSMREIWVATASSSGRPDATPVWFWWNGEHVYFTTKASSRKARNLSHQPELVVTNGDGADPIMIYGRAERVADSNELASIDQAY